MRKIRHFDVARLRELFSYDPVSGVVTRLTTKRAGLPCGTVFSTGHMQVSLDGKMVGIHRIAWALTHGEYPSREVDHINGDGADNRLCNLRLADSSQNNQNRRLSSRNKTGIKVVFRVYCNGRKQSYWRVAIGKSGSYHIKQFHCFGRAVKHSKEVRLELHGEFANTGLEAAHYV